MLCLDLNMMIAMRTSKCLHLSVSQNAMNPNKEVDRTRLLKAIQHSTKEHEDRLALQNNDGW